MEQSIKSQLSSRQFFAPSDKVTDDYDQFWIRYKPERLLRRSFKSWFLAAQICSYFIAASLMFIFLNTHLAPLALVAAVMVIVANTLRLQLVRYPTHICLTDEGLRVHWLRSFCNVSTTLIPWQNLTHVSIAKRKILGREESMLEFNISGGPVKLHQESGFPLVHVSSSWFGPGRSKVELALNGIASSDDRKRLQLALKKFVPSYRIEPAVSDELNLALRVETYTDLWVDAFNASSKRIRDDRLGAGETISDGRYEIVCELAAGGQAMVYEARVLKGEHVSFDEVVLKEFVLPAHAGANVRKRVLENIQKEAQLLKSLKHPNIVKLLDFFVEDQRAYLVLERVRGKTIKQLIDERGAMTEEQVVMLALQMSEILGYLHAHRIIHRDFTPDNLILGHGDILKLIDFNVAQQCEAESIKSVAGKHAYIPPEQFRGKPVQQSDLYAVGGTLFYMLTGIEPEPITNSRPRQHHPALSAEIDALVARATALDADERYASCVEFRKDLQKLKQRYIG